MGGLNINKNIIDFHCIPVTITKDVDYGFNFDFFVKNLGHFICGDHVKFLLGDIGWFSVYLSNKNEIVCFKIAYDDEQFTHLQINENLQAIFSDNNLEISQYTKGSEVTGNKAFSTIYYYVYRI